MYKHNFENLGPGPSMQPTNSQPQTQNGFPATQKLPTPNTSATMTVPVRGARRPKPRTKYFVPFNFSSMTPFDGISSFMRLAPIPHHVEPEPQAVELECVQFDTLPDQIVHQEMSHAIRSALSDEQWLNILRHNNATMRIFADGGNSEMSQSDIPRRFIADLHRREATFQTKTMNTMPMRDHRIPHIDKHNVQHQTHLQRVRPSTRLFHHEAQNQSHQKSHPSSAEQKESERREKPPIHNVEQQSQMPHKPPRSPHECTRKDLIARDQAQFAHVTHNHQSETARSQSMTKLSKNPREQNAVPQTKNLPQQAEEIVETPTTHNEEDSEEKEHEKELELERISKRVDAEEVYQFERYLQDYNHKVEKMHEDLQNSFRAQMRATGNLKILKDLHDKISIHAAKGHIEGVNPDVLKEVLATLQTRITSGNEHCKLLRSSTVSKVSAEQALLAMIAACTSLSVLTAQGLPRSLVIDENLERIVDLFRVVLTGIIFPINDPMYQIPTKAARQRTSETSDSTVGDGEFDREYNPPPLSAAESSRQPARTKRDNDALMDFSSKFSDILTLLFEKEKNLPNSIPSRCAAVCVQSMSINGIDRLQSHAIRTVCAIFKSYPAERMPILDDVRHACGILPSKRRHLRHFRVSDGVDIRATSALVANLMCLMDIPAFETLPPDAQNDPQKLKDIVSSRRDWYDSTVQMINDFLDPLFLKAASNKDQEYRAAFQAFIADMLTLYGFPEWPAAELILQTLTWRTVTAIYQDSNQSAFSLITALDTLGIVSAKLFERHGGETLCSHENPEAVTDEEIEEERETMLLYLKSMATRRAVDAAMFYESLFVSDDNMRLRKQKATEKQKQSGDHHHDDRNDENEDTADQRVSNEYLAVGKSAVVRARRISTKLRRKPDITDDDAFEATLFLSRRRTFVGGLDRILESIVRCMQFPAPTVRAKAIRSLGTIENACEGVLSRLPEILRFVEAGCIDVSTLVREASVDLLSRSVLSISCSDKTNEATLPDSQNQISEGHDDLSSHSAFLMIVKRLSDSATSVRKKSVYIMKSVLEETHRESEKLRNSPKNFLSSTKKIKMYEKRISDICLTLVDRLEDLESSVKEAAERALRLALLGFEVPDSSSNSRGITKTDRVVILTERVVRVFPGVPSASHSRFLARIVNEKVLRSHKRLIIAMVNAAMEKFESLEERLTDIDVPNDSSEGSIAKSALEEVANQRVACVSVMLAFGTLNSSLIVPHCRALAPSLKSVTDPRSTDHDRHCIQRILQILEIGLGHSQNLDLQFAESVVFDSEAIICQSPSTIVEEAAVKCLCAVVRNANSDNARRSMQHVAMNFKRFLELQEGSLKQYCSQTMPERPSSLERNARGALVRLGLLLRYGEFNQKFCEEVFTVLRSLCVTLSVVGTRDNLARAVISALFHFVTRHRNFLVDGTDVFVKALEFWDSQPTPVRIPESTRLSRNESCDSIPADLQSCHTHGEGVRQVILAGFFELLKDEEARNTVSPSDTNDKPYDNQDVSDSEFNDDDATGNSDVRNTSRKPRCDIVLAAEEDAEAGFLALSAQIFLPRLNRTVRSKSVSVRRNTASIYGLLVRQGLCPPATIVQSLFSLLLDNDSRCRDLSHRVIAFLADRHSDILASVVKKSIRSCFESSFASRNGLSFSPGTIDHTKPNHKQEVTEESTRYLKLITGIAIDDKTGKCWLSGALMALRGKRRKDVLKSLIDDFDPCVIVEKSNISIDPANVRNENDEERQLAPTPSPIKPEHEEDEDIGSVSTERLYLRSSRTIHRLPSLYFLAVTMACLDYTNGSGIGGCLVQGGGTTNAEKDLKFARECVTDLVSVATRIISNSGQSVLRLAKQMEKLGESFVGNKTEVALLASRICLLIQLKHHLKTERWRPLISNVDLKEDGSPADIQCKLPEFKPHCELLEATFGKEDNEIELGSAEIVEQCKLFYKLMQEDAIAESDLLVPSIRRRKSLGTSRRYASGRKSSTKRTKRKAVTNEHEPNRKRSKLQRRSTISRSLNFGENSDNDGSDYDPNV